MKNKIKQIWRQYATPIIAIPMGLFIIGFGGFRDGYIGGFVLGGIILAVGVVSFFTKDTQK